MRGIQASRIDRLVSKNVLKSNKCDKIGCSKPSMVVIQVFFYNKEGKPDVAHTSACSVEHLESVVPAIIDCVKEG